MASSSFRSGGGGAAASPFSTLSDDLLLHILLKLEDDPRHWSRLSCVSARFAHLIRHVCYKWRWLPSSPAPLASLPLAELHKLSVCCPGLLHSGVLLDDASDFGLERDIGPTHHPIVPSAPSAAAAHLPPPAVEECAWSLFDDLYFDTVYDFSEAAAVPDLGDPSHDSWLRHCSEADLDLLPPPAAATAKRKSPVGRHLAADKWSLSREQGRKLLASRFRGDALFLSDFPGCVHAEERRSYMLFRGVFKDFKRTSVWRTIEDGKRRALELSCAYCPCRETWDLHAAFCLRRVGYHDDGEPVVRAYVCENGHVSGTWTDTPPPCN